MAAAAKGAKRLRQEILTEGPVEKLYEIKQEVGKGNFSVVYEAVHKETKKSFACKIIQKNPASPNQFEMVESEVEIMRVLSHRNVVTIKDIFETETSYVIIMELITGGELFEEIVERQFYSEKDASQLVYQIIRGIQHCHEKKIVHRDVKPENLLLSAKGPDAIVKLADFGLASFLPTDCDGLLKKAVGTPSYLAPEVLMMLDGDVPGYDHQVDMWAVGVVMYILLCGFPPFYGEDDEEIYDQIVIGDYAFPSPFWDKISRSAKDLIQKLLVLDPKKRLTAEQALEHPWLAAAEQNPTLHLDDTIIKMKDFNAKRKFKKAILGVIAMNKFSKAFQRQLQITRVKGSRVSKKDRADFKSEVQRAKQLLAEKEKEESKKDDAAKKDDKKNKDKKDKDKKEKDKDKKDKKKN